MYRNATSCFLLLLAGCLATLLVACGGDGGSGEGSDPQRTEAVIGAGGGTLSSQDGRITVDVPAGALSADTTLSITPLAKEDLPPEFADLETAFAYDLGPDGLDFSQPVTATYHSGLEPVDADGSVELPLTLLLTSRDGQLEVLGEQRTELDPDTEAARSTATLTHFSPIVVYTAIWEDESGFVIVTDQLATLVVINGVPRTMAPGESFTAQVIVNTDLDRSLLDAVGQVQYFDPEELGENPIQVRGDSQFIIPRDAATETWNAEVIYDCVEPGGAGAYSAEVKLEGITFSQDLVVDDQIDAYFVVERTITCAAEEPGEEQALLLNPPVGRPGPPVEAPETAFLNFDRQPGDETLFAVAGDQGNLAVVNGGLENRDQVFIGGDRIFGSAALSFDFLSNGSPSVRDGLIVGGLDGAMAVQAVRGSPIRTSTSLVTDGNVTDVVPVTGDTAALVNFTGGEVDFVAPQGDAFGLRGDSGVIRNTAVEDEAIVSVWVPESGWGALGDSALVLTNPDPVTNDQPGSVFACLRAEAPDASPLAECQRLASVGRNPLRVRCVPEVAGETVCVTVSFDDQQLDLFQWSLDTAALTPLDTVDNVQGVTPAIGRDGDDVVFAVADSDQNELVGGRVTPDGTVTTRRVSAPSEPTVNGDPGVPVLCEGPEHLRFARRGASLIGTCAQAELLILISARSVLPTP